jgi:segregation and condensation protein A|tara:strand:- start:566 stop:1348 length:783 start_codon:yes stop_codon:yes gene_type:complete
MEESKKSKEINVNINRTVINEKVLELNIDNYEGPLDLLLDLAKTQKVDLMKISIVQLADQYIEFVDKIKKNLEIAADFLVMASWLAYLKSRLLLPEDFDDDFSAAKMAEKLKLQLRKLEMIRLLSDQLMTKKQMGVDIFFRGIREGIKKKNTPKYSLSLYELIKSYADFKKRKNFSSISIKKLKTYTMEEAIKKITSMFESLKEWCDICDLIPKTFKTKKNLRKTGYAGSFVAGLELVREGDLIIKQNKLFDKIYLKIKK